MVENQMRGFLLVHQWQLFCSCGSDESENVGVRAEARAFCTQRIGADQIAVFSGELLLRIGEQVFGLHGKAAQELAGLFMFAQITKNIARAHERQRDVVAGRTL